MKIHLILFCFVFTNLFSQNNTSVYYNESIKLFKEKRYDESMISIDHALKNDSLNRKYLIQKINILYNITKCDEALKVLNKIYEIYDKKKDDEIIILFCDLYDCMDKNKDATKILKYYVDNKEYKNSEVIVRLGQRLLNEGDNDNAILYYREYVKLNPNDIEAIIDLTRIVFTFKTHKEAEDILLTGLEKNPANLDVLIFLTAYYRQTKDYDKALEYQNKVIAINNSSFHIADRGGIFELKGMKKEAYEEYKKSVELDKCNPEYYSKILQYEFENRMYEKVIENSYKIIGCNASFENSILDGLYTSLFFCQNFEKGNLYLDKRLAAKPDNFNAYYIKGIILLNNKQYDDVLKNLDLAIGSSDVSTEDVSRVNLLKLGYYLVSERYSDLATYWKNLDSKTLTNSQNFTFTENEIGDKALINTYFDKNTGVINTTLTIPTKVVRLLREEYGVKIEINH